MKLDTFADRKTVFPPGDLRLRKENCKRGGNLSASGGERRGKSPALREQKTFGEVMKLHAEEFH